MIVAGADISDWYGYVTHRILDDGRILLAMQRPYNTQLSVSSTGWPNSWDDAW